MIHVYYDEFDLDDMAFKEDIQLLYWWDVALQRVPSHEGIAEKYVWTEIYRFSP